MRVHSVLKVTSHSREFSLISGCDTVKPAWVTNASDVNTRYTPMDMRTCIVKACCRRRLVFPQRLFTLHVCKCAMHVCSNADSVIKAHFLTLQKYISPTEHGRLLVKIFKTVTFISLRPYDIRFSRCFSQFNHQI